MQKASIPSPLNGEKPIFPALTSGQKDNTYTSAKWRKPPRANLLESYEGWNNWHYYLIPKGYVRPTITYTVNVTEGVDNEVSVQSQTIQYLGQSVTNVTWNFGDGSDEVTAGRMKSETHLYAQGYIQCNGQAEHQPWSALLAHSR
ncbi:MAG: hypothetical protein H6545_07035 [Bacteroidales bacterium]|nr:hypothetical protein [Bacteroidales bacterium]